MDKYARVRSIGRGSMGECMLVQNVQDQKLYVVKVVHMDTLSEEQQAAALNEVDVMSTLNHPNVINYVECFSTKREGKVASLYIVMEYAEGGDLRKRERTGTDGAEWTEAQILDLFTQICLAVEYCHRQRVLHRDLKPQNIFMAAADQVKLGDFGMSQMLDAGDDTAEVTGGTPYYFSPEMVDEQPCGAKADMWALGVVLYQLLTHSLPFGGRTVEQLFVKVAKGEYERLPARFSPGVRGLVEALLHRDPGQRPSASEVLHLPVVLDRLRHWELDALTDDTKRVYLQQLQQTHLYVDWPIACLAGELASPLRHITLPKRLATALRTIKGLLSDDGSELAGDEGDADPAPGAGPPAGPPAPPGEGAQNGPGAPQPVTAGPPAAPAQWVPPSPGAPVCQAFPWRRTGACVALGRRAVRYQSWPGFGFPAPSHGAPRAMASPRGRYKAARLKSWAGPGSEVERAPLPETAGPPPGAPEAVGLGAEGEGLALGAIPRATTLADFLSSLSQTGSPLGQGPLGEQDYAPGLAGIPPKSSSLLDLQAPLSKPNSLVDLQGLSSKTGSPWDLSSYTDPTVAIPRPHGQLEPLVHRASLPNTIAHAPTPPAPRLAPCLMPDVPDISWQGDPAGAADQLPRPLAHKLPPRSLKARLRRSKAGLPASK